MRIKYCELTKKRMESFFPVSPLAQHIGEIALRSMLLELSASPKPGLVDRFNSGSHKDMDFETFLQSISAIAPYFVYISQIGLDHNPSEPISLLLPRIRQIGLYAEEKMFSRTGGVNTQKGIIFLLALISAGAGYLLSQKKPVSSTLLSNVIQEICKDLVENELSLLHKDIPGKLTSGEKVYLKYGLTGIRGEAEKGFPVIIKFGLPPFYDALKNGLNLNYSCLHALCSIMANLDDTALLNRHDLYTLRLVQGEMKNLTSRGGLINSEVKKIWPDLEKEYNEKKINPGGSADMLTGTLMFYYLETEDILKKDLNNYR